MTTIRLSSLALPFALSLAAACSAPPAPAAPAAGSETAAPAPGPGAPAANGGADAASAMGGAGGTVTGVVAETMNSGGYTYARLTQGGKDSWIAATEMPITVGETVTAAVSMPMENFHSRTLNRDFPIIYFVGEVARNGQPLTGAAAAPASGSAAVPMANSHAGTAAAPDASEPAKLITLVAPAPGGHTVADLWAGRQKLSGTVVIVRGQVMKRNNEIMGKNWFHLQDGTGNVAKGTHDLTITTSEAVTVGDIVTVTGTLLTNQDFGAGYTYEAMIENAVVKK